MRKDKEFGDKNLPNSLDIIRLYTHTLSDVSLLMQIHCLNSFHCSPIVGSPSVAEVLSNMKIDIWIIIHHVFYKLKIIIQIFLVLLI